jgi:glycosyltransferase involved in cell wall biosynthesis
VQQLLVVDDGSSDDSADVAARLGVQVIRLPENRGPSAARNVAIRAAAGDLVAFLDADDLWIPEHCEILSDVLERHPEVALVTGRTQQASPFDSGPFTPPLETPFDALPYLVRDNFVTQSAAVVRRDALSEAGGYDERLRFSEDFDLWLRIALRHPMIALREVTVMRRMHEGQATWKNMAPLYSAKWKLRLGLLDSAELRVDHQRMQTVTQALRDAVHIDFDLTWRDLDAESFSIVEAAARDVPGSTRTLRRWYWRRLLLWHVWVTAVRSVRLMRRVRRRAGGSPPRDS